MQINIDASYTATHVDTRTSNKWYGDEIKGTSASVCTDFYSYYGIPKSAKKTLDMTVSVEGVTYSGTLTEK